jgi:hypothetical protein
MRTGIFLLFVVVLLYGCPPCETITLDNGPLPDSLLAKVPYQDGNTYSFQHSNGQVINYTAQRATEKELMHCDHCCDYNYNYEINTTKLTPDYPVFNISLRLSNSDTIHHEFSCNIGKYFLNIPLTRSQYYVNFDFADSLQIGNTFYKEVFKIKPYNHYLYDEPVKVDSLFYNYTDGILLIKMSNEEYYRIMD